MSITRPAPPRLLVAGVVLVLVGVLSWVLYAVQTRREHHSYSPGATAPNYVRLVAGHTYWLAIPDGVNRELRLGLDPAALQCSAALAGQAPGALQVTAEKADSKATDQIASFTAGFSGTAHLECTGIGTVYVDNAADAGFDWSGLWLVLASLALAVGLPLTLAALRRRGR